MAELTYDTDGRHLYQPDGSMRRADHSVAIVASAGNFNESNAAELMVLTALGKPRDCLRSEKRLDDARHLARIWAAAERVSVLEVSSADTLRPAVVEALVDILPARCRVHLSFVTTPSDRHLKRLRQPQPASHPRPRTPPQPAAAVKPMPSIEGLVLPDASYLTFRHDCHRWLSRSVADAVDRQYLRGYRTGWRFLVNRNAFADPVTPAAAGVQSLCEDVALKAPSATHLHIRLKGLQAAFLYFGFNLRVEEPVLQAQRVSFHQLLEVADRLRFLASPRPAAAAALSFLDPNAMALLAMRLQDIDPTNRTATIRHKAQALGGNLFPLIEVLRLHRLTEGASPDDLLFVNNAGKPAGRQFAQYCRRATRFTGVAIPSTRFRSDGPTFVSDLSARVSFTDVRNAP